MENAINQPKSRRTAWSASSKRQRGRGQLLAGLQGEQVGAFLVGVGESEVVGAGLQRGDQALVKSWRFCTIERFEPKAEACVRSVLEAVVNFIK